MQVADEAVGEGAERLVVQVAGGAPPVVELAASRARAQRAHRPLVGGVGEPPVADEAGLHGALAPRCYGERRGAGVVSAGERRVVAFGVILELAEHPWAPSTSLDDRPWNGSPDADDHYAGVVAARLEFEQVST